MAVCIALLPSLRSVMATVSIGLGLPSRITGAVPNRSSLAMRPFLRPEWRPVKAARVKAARVKAARVKAATRNAARGASDETRWPGGGDHRWRFRIGPGHRDAIGAARLQGRIARHQRHGGDCPGGGAWRGR